MKTICGFCALVSVLLAQQTPPPVSVPVCIGVCVREHPWDAARGAEDAHVLGIVGTYHSGKWLPSDFLVAPPVGKEEEPLKPSQDAFLDTQIGQTFYSCDSPPVTLAVEKKAPLQLMDDERFLGLGGTLSESGALTIPHSAIAMSNVRSAGALRQDKALTDCQKELFAKRMKSGCIEKVKALPHYDQYKETPLALNADLYQAPQFKEAVRWSLPSGWTGLWVSCTLPYPVDQGPKSEAREPSSEWSGYYCALVELRGEELGEVLWEHADCESYYHNKGYSLMGVFDVSKDGIPEFLMCETAVEYKGYAVSTIQDGRLHEISAIRGSI